MGEQAWEVLSNQAEGILGPVLLISSMSASITDLKSEHLGDFYTDISSPEHWHHFVSSQSWKICFIPWLETCFVTILPCLCPFLMVFPSMCGWAMLAIAGSRCEPSPPRPQVSRWRHVTHGSWLSRSATICHHTTSSQIICSMTRYFIHSLLKCQKYKWIFYCLQKRFTTWSLQLLNFWRLNLQLIGSLCLSISSSFGHL